MSLHTPTSRWLTLRPKVKEAFPVLEIRSGFLQQLFTLFSCSRSVRIDTENKTITFVRRAFWLYINSYVIGFQDVHYMEYEYKSFGTSWGMSMGGCGRQDEVEMFVISLVDQEGQKHEVTAFQGEGAVNTGWSGMLMGDDSFFDYSGTQEGESRDLVDGLKQILQVPIGKPILEDVEMKTCPGCDREVAVFASKCTYCAYEFPAEEAESSPQASASAPKVQRTGEPFPCPHSGRKVGANATRCMFCGQGIG